MSILVSPDPRFLSSGSGLRAVSASLSNRAGSSSDRAPLALAMALAIRSSMGVVDDGDRAIDGFLRMSTRKLYLPGLAASRSSERRVSPAATELGIMVPTRRRSSCHECGRLGRGRKRHKPPCSHLRAALLVAGGDLPNCGACRLQPKWRLIGRNRRRDIRNRPRVLHHLHKDWRSDCRILPGFFPSFGIRFRKRLLQTLIGRHRPPSAFRPCDLAFDQQRGSGRPLVPSLNVHRNRLRKDRANGGNVCVDALYRLVMLQREKPSFFIGRIGFIGKLRHARSCQEYMWQERRIFRFMYRLLQGRRSGSAPLAGSEPPDCIPSTLAPGPGSRLLFFSCRIPCHCTHQQWSMTTRFSA